MSKSATVPVKPLPFGFESKGALVLAVESGSPADEGGFKAGDRLISVNGHWVRDLIDWRWYAAEDEIVVRFFDSTNVLHEEYLERSQGQDWGFTFDGIVFDGIKQCRNACTFCFIQQLPQNMRASLCLRDDDYRLSFLTGTFVTLTNITPADEQRIVAQHLTPLHVSLQASDPSVRESLIGRHAPKGLAVLERLLKAGIQFYAQIVLVPHVNDGAVLRDTLDWAWERPGILSVGIVPLGFTRHQTMFQNSFNDAASAQSVLDCIAPYQIRAAEKRGRTWVFAADEFYSNAYETSLLDHLPHTAHYDDFALFEDGIGMIRSTVDDWHYAQATQAIDRCQHVLDTLGFQAVLIAGYAQQYFLSALIKQSHLDASFRVLYVENEFFGGNVDVTGLLVGSDIVRAIADDYAFLKRCFINEGKDKAHAQCMNNQSKNDREKNSATQGQTTTNMTDIPGLRRRPLYVIFRVVFNDDGLTLDNLDATDIQKAAGVPVGVVSCSPREYFNEIAQHALKFS